MAERIMIVCDVCGEVAAERVTIRAGGRMLQKDLCSTQVAELLRGASPARRGRPPVMTVGTEAAPAPRRRGRPRTGPPAIAKANAKSPRRRITDPAVLKTRRAALAKARQVLAAKRAARARAGKGR